MKLDIVFADYDKPEHARDLVHLLNTYAMDPMGGGKELSRHVQQNLVPSLASITGAFSVLAYADGEWQIFETGGSTKVEGLPWPTHGGIDPDNQIGGAFTPPQAHFSGDNRYLVTASGDGMLQIWCRN